MFSIILMIIAIVAVVISLILSLINDRTDWSIVYLGLLVLDIVFLGKLICDYRQYNSQEYCVEKVVKYEIKPVVIINGTDTTKTYTITYWK